MIWLLTLFLLVDGQGFAQPVGVLISESACRLAGAGMAQAMMAGTPGTLVTFSCDVQGGVS
jgi:hypothetical protein